MPDLPFEISRPHTQGWLFNLRRPNLFVVEFRLDEDILNYKHSGEEEFVAVVGGNYNIDNLITEVGYPQRFVTASKYQRDGIDINVPLSVDIEKMVEFQFYDDNDGILLNTIDRWMKKVYRGSKANSFIEYPNTVKKDMHLYMLDSAMHIKKYVIYKGMFPQSRERIMLSYNNGDMVNSVIVTFYFDSIVDGNVFTQNKPKEDTKIMFVGPPSQGYEVK